MLPNAAQALGLSDNEPDGVSVSEQGHVLAAEPVEQDPELPEAVEYSVTRGNASGALETEAVERQPDDAVPRRSSRDRRPPAYLSDYVVSLCELCS